MTVSMHPPTNRRCQIYVVAEGESSHLPRCTNEGTHWEKWGGCDCIDTDVCEGDYFSWECDGDHAIEAEVACA